MLSRDPDTYIAGGYFITRLRPRPDGAAEDLLPGAILSASDCLAPHIPDLSLFSWATSGQEGRMIGLINAFQIPLPSLDMLVDWMTHEYEREVGHPNIFYHLSTAQEVARNFFPNRDDILVCGLGLHQSLVPRFLQTARPPGFATGIAPEAPLGTWKAIASGRQLDPGGERLGFELIVYDLQANELTCSWLCNGLEREFHTRYGIVPNQYGLIDALPDAVKCAAQIEQGVIGAEPGLWLPWLLVHYPVEPVV